MGALNYLFRAVSWLVAGVALASCGLVQGDGRYLQPIPQVLLSKFSSIGSTPGDPMLVRLFKEESELEVWKQTRDGTFKLVKTYAICSWSGDLGPKFKEGDRQSPEGFYTISPGLMNPNSSYYLAVNTGFPNKFDRVWGRTGSNLMIHGDCSSSGCYAMTDAQIAEIYAMAREALAGGQRSFELQLYPFRMTNENMLKHRSSPYMDFWRNLKIGYDAFELSKRAVKWDVCERKYVFFPGGSGALDANGACPADTSAPDLMAQVSAKQISDLDAFKIASADLDATEAKQEADRVAAADAAAARSRAIAENGVVVKQTTQAITNAVGGFFGSLFGGAAKVPQAGQVAPVPAPAIKRS